MDKFKNKQGLTQYALACGHIQREKIDHVGYYNEVDLFLNGCVYTITVSYTVVDSNNKLVTSDRMAWLCFDSLTDARKEYKRQIKLCKAGAL